MAAPAMTGPCQSGAAAAEDERRYDHSSGELHHLARFSFPVLSAGQLVPSGAADVYCWVRADPGASSR